MAMSEYTPLGPRIKPRPPSTHSSYRSGHATAAVPAHTARPYYTLVVVNPDCSLGRHFVSHGGRGAAQQQQQQLARLSRRQAWGPGVRHRQLGIEDWRRRNMAVCTSGSPPSSVQRRQQGHARCCPPSLCHSLARSPPCWPPRGKVSTWERRRPRSRSSLYPVPREACVSQRVGPSGGPPFLYIYTYLYAIFLFFSFFFGHRAE